MAKKELSVVAIIGRPNVGKSTLFNRIAGGRKAIVHDEPGVTRDRLETVVTWEGSAFTLVDTGGFETGASNSQARMVTAQARKAVKGADVIIFLVDGTSGLTPLDLDVARDLRRGGKTVFLAINKVDNPAREVLAADFASLGFDPLYTVSAEHGRGVAELLDGVISHLPRADGGETAENVPRIAVVGRPNVGKSTLINQLLGEERMLTDDRPGTTRDAIDTTVRIGDREYVFIDTAGMRRRGRIRRGVEKYSVLRAERAVFRSDICLVLLDAMEMVTDQDARIIGLTKDAGRGCIILVNKWDLIKDMEVEAALKLIRETVPFVSYAPVFFISALTGRKTGKIFPAIDKIYVQLMRSIPGPKLNQFLYQATRAFRPGSYQGKPVSFGYMTQIKVNPPTFVVLTNEPARVHFTYRRYLTNRLREAFDFEGIPLVIKFRHKKRRK